MCNSGKTSIPLHILHKFKISASDFGTVDMHRRKRACTDEFLATVTEGVVQGV